MTSKIQQAVNFTRKRIQDLKKSSKNNELNIKVNNEEAQKQISQVQKQIESLQKKINERQLKLNVTNSSLDKIRADTNQSVINQMPNAGNKVIKNETYSRLDNDATFKSLVKDSDKLNSEIVKYNTLLESAKNKMAQLQMQTSKTANSQSGMSNILNKFKRKIEQAKVSTGRLKNAFSSIPKTTKNIANNVGNITAKFKGGLGQIFKVAGALFSLQSIYSTLSNVANTWLSSQNSQAKQLSANIDYMKYALGSTLAPVIQWIVNLIYQALKGVQSLIYALTGVNIFANASAKAYSNMAKSAGSAKKATESLAPGDIDEVHNIEENIDSGAGAGGSGGDITPNIDLGTVNTKLNDFLRKIKEGKWFEAGVEIGKKINESLEKIPWNSIKEKASNIGKGIAEFINGGVSGTDWSLMGKTIAEGLNTAITFIKSFITTLDLASIVDSVFNFLTSAIFNIDWGSILYTIFYLIGANWGMQLRVLYNVITTACSAIGQFFSKKIEEAGGNVALGLWNGILEGLGNIVKWLYDNVVAPIINGFKNGLGIHSPSTVMFEIGGYIIEGLINGILNMISNLGTTISTICGNVKIWFGEKLSKNKFVQNGKNAIEGIKNGIQNNSMFSTIKSKCNDVRTWFSDRLQSNKFISSGKNIVNGIKDGIKGNSLSSTIKSKCNDVRTWFSDRLQSNKFISSGKNIVNGIKDGIKGNSAYSTISTVCGNVKNWFKSKLGSSNFTNIGSNILGGIKRGINNAKNSLLNTASSIARSITSKFKNVLGIHSPSRVLADYVGRFIPLGIAEGIKDKADAVYDSIKDITSNIKLDKQGIVSDMPILNNNYTVQPIPNLINANNIASNISNMSAPASSTINFENVLKLNGKTIAREIVDDLNEEIRRRGYKPILQH